MTPIMLTLAWKTDSKKTVLINADRILFCLAAPESEDHHAGTEIYITDTDSACIRVCETIEDIAAKIRRLS